MKNALFSLLLVLLTFSNASQAQIKPYLDQIKKNDGPPHSLETVSIKPFQPSIPTVARPFSGIHHSYRTLPPLTALLKNGAGLRVEYSGRRSIPVAIYGESASASAQTDPVKKIFAQLQDTKDYLQIRDPAQEFRIISSRVGKNGYTHFKLQQYYREVPVYGGQLTIHLKDAEVTLLTGRNFPSPTVTRTVPAVPVKKAIEKATREVEKEYRIQSIPEQQRKMMGLETNKTELVIYHSPDQGSRPNLAWRVELVPNIHQRQVYFIDAQTEDVLFRQDLLCKVHGFELPPNGPAVGQETDLLEQLRTVNSYEINGDFLLIDASRPMFNPNITFDPSDPQGVIWTLDAENETPIENDDFSVSQIISNSSGNWPDASAVSAHYNAGQAYEYFRTTFGRNSINNLGGTILSIINVADEDGEDMGNAFWSGSALFYGNGDNAFSPLAGSLDVAGHEMAHGVVQTTANLESISQSGALNESFADIFGAMIDRADWQIGEDVVRPAFFPSGALRDLSNPNNGGTGLNNHFWQPAHMDEYVELPETEEGDNGGVHINSGITNRAFYLFATAVGKDVAEQVYYNALVNYLTRISQFVDLRIAVLASANELYNNSVAAAAGNAFDQVGILGDTGTDQPDDLDPNAGQELVIFADATKESLNLYRYGETATAVAEPLITMNISSRPSITDDGSLMVFVDGQQFIQLATFDWVSNQFSVSSLSEEGVWRTAAISKDGRFLAALSNDFDDNLYVFRLDNGAGRAFQLYNPTTAEGITTGTVSYADILEWSLDGKSIMYDALSTISKVDGTIQFWDIGFIEVWDDQAEDFSDGYISKLFSGLPDGISVGNPTFSKNSPFIIAMDYIDETSEDYLLLGVNALTGDIGTIFENSDLNFPNYSVKDDAIIFDGFNQTGNRILARIPLAADKINSAGNAFVFISGQSGARWGTVFATGNRDLSTGAKEPVWQEEGLKVYPNPVRDQLQVELQIPANEAVILQLTDQLGRRVYSRRQNPGSGTHQISIPMENLAAGTYILDIRQNARRWRQRIVKLN